MNRFCDYYLGFGSVLQLNNITRAALLHHATRKTLKTVVRMSPNIRPYIHVNAVTHIELLQKPRYRRLALGVKLLSCSSFRTMRLLGHFNQLYTF